MPDIDKVTNQPMEIELRGKKYKISQITIGDYGKMIRHLKQLHAEDTAKTLKAVGLKEYEIVKVVRDMIEENWEGTGKTGEKAGEKFRAKLGGYDSSIYVIYLALKKNHREITLEEVYDLISVNEIKVFGDIVGYIFGIEKEKEKNSPKSEPKE